MRKTPVKGKPDFSFLDDKRVKQYEEVISAMMSSYSGFPDKVELLKEIWSDLKDENVDRICVKPEKEIAVGDKLSHCRKIFLRNRKIRT